MRTIMSGPVSPSSCCIASSSASATPVGKPDESRYRALIDASLGIVWRSAPDLSVLEAWGWDEATGQAKGEYTGQGWLDVVHPEDRDGVLVILENGRRRGEPFEGTYRARQADGHYRWVHARLVPLRENSGTIREWVGTLLDMHDKMEADAALRTAEERLRLALENSAVGVWEYDFRTHAVWWSETKKAVLGVPDDHPMTQEAFLALVHPDDRSDVEAGIARAKRAENGRFDSEFRIRRHADGEEVWLSSCGQVFFDAAGHPLRIVGTMRDITAQRAAQQKLYQLAHFDQLTGLANRVHFIARLEEAVTATAAAAVILLDLDGFKNVNDTAGHHAGDLLLRAAAQRVATCLPHQALAARWGGDEFAILVPAPGGMPPYDHLLRTIEAAFETPFTLLGRDVFLSMSIGVAVAPAHGRCADDLLQNADLALYQAKADGRGVSRVFSPALKQKVQGRIDLETDLRRAFAASEFEMHYQPQVLLAGGATLGAEALLRWRHPQRGLLAPLSFLQVLKTSPIAKAVGDWTLATSCAWAARCLRAGKPARVAVNLFSAQIRAGGLLDTVRRCLEENELPPELLEIEITENTMLKGETVIDTLRELRKLGIGIAFDDYGTGYASLSMLTEYPLTRLKIDKTFVSRLTERGDEAVVKAIVNLGHAFGLKVTAEGIETEEQARLVRALGCDEGQGYLYGRPLPGETLLARLGAVERKPSQHRCRVPA